MGVFHVCENGCVNLLHLFVCCDHCIAASIYCQRTNVFIAWHVFCIAVCLLCFFVCLFVVFTSWVCCVYTWSVFYVSRQNCVVLHDCNKNATLNKNSQWAKKYREGEVGERGPTTGWQPENQRESQREPERASERATESHRDSLWLSLTLSDSFSDSLLICLQSPCLAHNFLARLVAALLRFILVWVYPHIKSSCRS